MSEPPENGVYVHGLFMEACRWDAEQEQLVDSLPGEPYESAPILLLIPSDAVKTHEDMYSMPLYKTSSRAGNISTIGSSNNYITSFDIPTNRKQIYWMLKGAALLCQPEY